MKICVLVVLLVLMAFQSANKTIVMISFYINKDYIEKNVCENRFENIPICKGQCYLDKQLKKSENQSNPLPTIKLKEIQLFYSENSCIENHNNYEYRINQKHLFTYNELIIKSIHSSIFHPPQIS